MTSLSEMRALVKDQPQIPRRRIEIHVPAEVLVDDRMKDFKLVLHSLTGHEEVQAAQSARGSDALSITHEMVKLSIESVNGDPVLDREGDRQMIWEQVLGQSGRNYIMKYFQNLIITDEEIVKNAEAQMRYL